MATRIFVFAIVTVALLLGSFERQAMAGGQEQPTGVVTFHKDALPILQKNCQSCHRPGQIGPMSLMSYKEARPWTKAIKAALQGPLPRLLAAELRRLQEEAAAATEDAVKP